MVAFLSCPHANTLNWSDWNAAVASFNIKVGVVEGDYFKEPCFGCSITFVVSKSNIHSQVTAITGKKTDSARRSLALVKLFLHFLP